MASTAPQAAPESESDLRKRIADLESQLDAAYADLSKLNGNGSSRPAKRARTADVSSTSNDEPTLLPDARIIRWNLQYHIDNITDQVRSQGPENSPQCAESYEDQWESKLAWYEAIAKPLQSVLDVGIGLKSQLKECNEILKMVADSFDALMACGTRMDSREELNESAATIELTLPWGEKDKHGKVPNVLVCTGMHVENAWLWVWVVLLRVHAELGREEDKDVLLQCIKDCRAHEVGPGYISLTTEEPLPQYLSEISESVIVGDLKNCPGGEALAKIVKEGAWNKLRCNRRVRVKPSSQDDQHSDEDEDENDYYDEGIYWLPYVIWGRCYQYYIHIFFANANSDDGDYDGLDDTLNETTDTLNATGDTYEDGKTIDYLVSTYTVKCLMADLNCHCF